MNERMLRLPDVIDRTKLCRSTIYSMIAQSKFPRQVALGERAVGWRKSDIDEWIRSRIDAVRVAHKKLSLPSA